MCSPSQPICCDVQREIVCIPLTLRLWSFARQKSGKDRQECASSCKHIFRRILCLETRSCRLIDAKNAIISITVIISDYNY